MKQQLYEKIIKQMVASQRDHHALKSLSTKADIIRRGGNSSASVIKEVMEWPDE